MFDDEYDNRELDSIYGLSIAPVLSRIEEKAPQCPGSTDGSGKHSLEWDPSRLDGDRVESSAHCRLCGVEGSVTYTQW
jgi:hypothetical protein